MSRKCLICNNELKTKEHNDAYPFGDGECCDDCFNDFVYPVNVIFDKEIFYLGKQPPEVYLHALQAGKVLKDAIQKDNHIAVLYDIDKPPKIMRFDQKADYVELANLMGVKDKTFDVLNWPQKKFDVLQEHLCILNKKTGNKVNEYAKKYIEHDYYGPVVVIAKESL